ncbi:MULTISPECIES: hypothetical protein [unclassified Rhodococcus (in: high G+C Gram-positive bacteria)]|uniref:hypothetical protein n=1 Tax=unclassified Rhodococcus (in: high G+C Gram-positive bacteria) TaxID=192944 RepID=UPI001BB42270
MLLRIGISASLAVSGYIHADLYRHGDRHIPVVGPSFLLQAAAAFAIAVLLLLGGPFLLRLAAAAVAGGALVGFVLSRTVGVFGFIEIGWQPAPQAAVSVAAEVATIVLCAASLLLRWRSRPRRRRSWGWVR